MLEFLRSIWNRIIHIKVFDHKPIQRFYVGPYLMVSRGKDIQEVVYSRECPRNHRNRFIGSDNYCSICGSELLIKEQTYSRPESFKDILNSIPEEYQHVFAIVDTYHKQTCPYILLPLYGEKNFGLEKGECYSGINLEHVDFSIYISECIQEYHDFITTMKEQDRAVQVSFGVVEYTVST
jgi:hypothetical protein